jgi:hypothetical protein
LLVELKKHSSAHVQKDAETCPYFWWESMMVFCPIIARRAFM